MNPKQCMLTLIPWWTEGALVKINDHQNRDRLCNARIELELQLKMFQSTKHLVTHNTSSRFIIHARVIYIGSFFTTTAYREKYRSYFHDKLYILWRNVSIL